MWYLFFLYFSVIVNHATTQGPFHSSTCPQCPAKFTNYSEYKKHLEDIHNDEKICGSCGKFFINEEILKNHVTQDHKGVKFTRKGTEKKGKYNPNKKVVCDLCGKPFAGSLYTHKMKVSGKIAEYLCAANFGTPALSAHNSFSLHTLPHRTCAFFDNFATSTPAHFTGTLKIEWFIWYTCVVSNHT